MFYVQEPDPGPDSATSRPAGPRCGDGPGQAYRRHGGPGRGPGPPDPFALAAGVLSGLTASLVWEAGAATSPRGFEVVMILGSEQTIVTVQGRGPAGIRGGAASAAILGAAIGLGLGIAGGFARRDVRAGLVAGLAGAILGCAGRHAPPRGCCCRSSTATRARSRAT